MLHEISAWTYWQTTNIGNRHKSNMSTPLTKIQHHAIRYQVRTKFMHYMSRGNWLAGQGFWGIQGGHRLLIGISHVCAFNIYNTRRIPHQSTWSRQLIPNPDFSSSHWLLKGISESCAAKSWCLLWSLSLSYQKKDWRVRPGQSFFWHDNDYNMKDTNYKSVTSVIILVWHPLWIWDLQPSQIIL